jgi:hypothetical protein
MQCKIISCLRFEALKTSVAEVSTLQEHPLVFPYASIGFEGQFLGWNANPGFARFPRDPVKCPQLCSDGYLPFADYSASLDVNPSLYWLFTQDMTDGM